MLVEAGRIAAVGPRRSIRIPPGTKVIDTSGHTITAGFWNSHVHFIQRKWADPSQIPAQELAAQLQAMLTRYGFTSVFDTWSMWETTRVLRERIDSGEVGGPRIRSTGEAIFPRGGAAESPGAQAAWGVLGFMPLDRFRIARVAGASQALGAATNLLEAGMDSRYTP